MAEWLSNTSSWIELVLNVIEAIAIIVSVVTFLYLMFNKFSVGLRRILSSLGLGLGNGLRILFICRKSQNKKRMFLEYAILETKGIPIIRKQWSYLISSFKTFYALNEDKSVYSIKNCTLLTTQDFSNAVQRYFDYFNLPKVKRAFGIQENLSFLMTIKIEEAYIMPTCLLNGLLSSFGENWEEFIRQYVSTAYLEDKDEVHKILPDELYYTFNWLLWGPSYELEYRNGLWGGLCQISYGDESISVPAIADTSKTMTSSEGEESTIAMRLREEIIKQENHEVYPRYGVLVSAIVRIYDEIPFYKTFEKEINPHNAYFYDKIKKDELPFGVKIENFSPITNYKTYKYYSTAYVWALFIEESDSNDLFRPEKCVAFYEHANIADKETYKFLVESVINKSLLHFRRLMNAGGIYRERKYRFLLAMNDRIAESVARRYKEEMEKGDEFAKYLKSHISFEIKFSPQTIFQGFDEYFMPIKSLKFVEVNIDDKKSLSYLGEFYTDIYIDVFHDKNERETFDNLLGYLESNKENGGNDYSYHILLAIDDNNRVMGGCIFDYFVKSNSAAIEFLAVREEKQSGGYGTLIYNQVMTILNNDAIRNKKISVDDIVIEINNPAFNKEDDPMKYLYFWDKFAFQHLDFDYIQPPLDEEKEEVRNLWLAYLSPKYQREHTDDPFEKEVNKSLILNILADYFKYAMRIDEPSESSQYVEMDNSIKDDVIKTSPIIKNR